MTEAATIREFNAHPGMKLLVAKLDKRIDLRRNEWLNASNGEEAEAIRQNARVYAALMSLLNEFLLRGQQAEQLANAQQSTSTEPVNPRG